MIPPEESGVPFETVGCAKEQLILNTNQAHTHVHTQYECVNIKWDSS